MAHEEYSCHSAPLIDRRRFVALAATAGGALEGSIALPHLARAAGGTDALLLNCMDYRLTGKVTEYMTGLGMAGKYDQVILAGASLGAVTQKFPDWGRTFHQHLSVAIELHHIHEVFVIDHRDCGAYKVILGHDYAGDPVAETKIHTEMLHLLRHEINRHHPKLGVRLGLMGLDGNVETIA